MTAAAGGLCWTLCLLVPAQRPALLLGRDEAEPELVHQVKGESVLQHSEGWWSAGSHLHAPAAVSVSA